MATEETGLVVAPRSALAPAPLTVTPIELEDTFDDSSLEMNAAGDKFRVAAALQAAITTAQSTADGAQTAANTAQSTANAAQTTANAALAATAGSVLAVRRTETVNPISTTLIIPNDNTIPQVTEGAAYSDLDTTITPKAASSTLLVEVFFPLISASTILNLIVAIFRDSGVDAVGVGVNSVEATNRFRQATRRVPGAGRFHGAHDLPGPLWNGCGRYRLRDAKRRTSRVLRRNHEGELDGNGARGVSSPARCDNDVERERREHVRRD